MLKQIFVLLSIAALGAAASAQEMTPPKELNKLAWMVGEWKGTTHMIVSGETMDSESVFTVSWEGQFMKMVTDNDAGGMKTSETSYLSWDAKKKKYVMYTFTGFAPTPRIETGNSLSHNQWAFYSEPWNVMGENFLSRAIHTKDSKDAWSFKLAFKKNGKWIDGGWGKFTRVK